MRSIAAAVILGACWTGTAAVPDPRVAKVKRCEIHDADVTVTGTATLSIEGLAFANQPGPFTRLDVTFHDAVGRAKLETESLVLEGEIDRVALPVRPRELGWQDGWIEIHSATARTATADSLRINVELPEGLAPRTAQFSLPCAGLTFAVVDAPETEATLPPVSVAIGADLYARPGGPAIARVTGYRAPDAMPNDATEALQVSRLSTTTTAKDMTQVRIEGTNPMRAWVSTSMIEPAVGDQLGGFGFGRSGYGRHHYTCSRDVGIYVRVGGRAIRVGRIKKDSAFHLSNDADSEDDEIGLELGMPAPGTVPFLKKSDFGHCG